MYSDMAQSAGEGKGNQQKKQSMNRGYGQEGRGVVAWWHGAMNKEASRSDVGELPFWQSFVATLQAIGIGFSPEHRRPDGRTKNSRPDD
jgi:hypothetical protein